MYNCDKDIRNLHGDRINLPERTRQKLRDNREANEKRVKSGLEKNGDPQPDRFVKQGSYAMKTMVQDQHGVNNYDIDDGIVFFREDIKGPNGADKTPLDSRKMVRDAVDDESFTTPPAVKTNCVRIQYDDGHHVDMPVYRCEPDHDSTEYELASVEWKTSNPEGVTKWFEDQLRAKKSPEEETDSYQMRRLVRMLKYWGNSRKSWNMPSGFVWTVLVDEAYNAYDDREDRALYNTMTRIHDRVKSDKVVYHPVVKGEKIADEGDACMVQCEQHLKKSIDELKILFSNACTRSKALKAWKKVFNTDYFDDEIKKAEEAEKAKAAAFGAGITVQPKPWAWD
jgi:hypothetical protein